jgi:hypothetical protein
VIGELDVNGTTIMRVVLCSRRRRVDVARWLSERAGREREIRLTYKVESTDERELSEHEVTK